MIGFVRAIGVVAILALVGQCASGADSGDFFRVRMVDGAWWFIAPDGSRFFSSGVNVADVGGKPHSDCPAKPEYAAFRHYKDTNDWALATQKRLAEWGFNTVGGWSAHEMKCGPMPYTEVLHLGKELGAPWIDVFDPKFVEQVDQLAERQVAPSANEKLLIGWFTDNELAWFADTLFAFHIGQPADSLTRQKLIELLREQYDGDFARLEHDFEPVGPKNFTELAAGGKLRVRPGGQGMAVADKFLYEVAKHFYKICHDAIRRHDPNHLILGDRYHGFCPDPVAEAAGPYVDVISTNFDQPDWTNGRLPAFYLERLHKLTGRPVIVSEYYVAAHENRSGNKNSGDVFTTVSTQTDRAEAVRTRMTFLASLPYVVGAHWFQFYDQPTFGRHDGEDYNFGLVDIENRPYDELVAAFIQVHEQLPQLHSEAGRLARADDSRPQPVPAAPLEPLIGIALWDPARSLIPCVEATSLGDLLVTWDAERVYLALACSAYIDPGAYADEAATHGDRLVWEIDTGQDRPLLVRFGAGDKIVVSDSAAESRLLRRGLHYTVIIAVPSAEFGLDRLAAGDQMRLISSLKDPRRKQSTSWDRQIVCAGPLRQSLSQQDPATRSKNN